MWRRAAAMHAVLRCAASMREAEMLMCRRAAAVRAAVVRAAAVCCGGVLGWHAAALYLLKKFRGAIRGRTVGHGDTTDESPVLSMTFRRNIPLNTLESLKCRPIDNDPCFARHTVSHRFQRTTTHSVL